MSMGAPQGHAAPHDGDGSVVIARRFQGPPQSANGGYTAGLLAAHERGVVCITLRQPPPLDEPLALRGSGDELHLLSGERMNAHAVPAVLPGDVPAAVAIEAAAAASEQYAWKTGHVFPGMFRVRNGARGSGRPAHPSGARPRSARGRRAMGAGRERRR